MSRNRKTGELDVLRKEKIKLPEGLGNKANKNESVGRGEMQH